MSCSVYVASPLGFSAPGRLWNQEVLLPTLERHGLDVLDPWSKPAATASFEGTASAAGNAGLGAANEAMIKRAAGLLIVLDGSDVDSGSAAELGYAAALGKPTVGFRSDFRITSDNAAASVNLQVEYWIGAGGGSIHRDLDAAAVEMYRLLTVAS